MNREEFSKRLKGKMSPSLVKTIALSYRIAKYGHRDQERDSGERYFEHPRAVALILIDELGIFDHEMIIAALLHDVIGDTFIFGIEEVELIFGSRVAEMIGVLSKVLIINEGNPFEMKKVRTCCYLEDLEKADADTIIIKLADRLHNLRTLDGCRPEKRKRILDETIKIFLPLAEKTHGLLYANMVDEVQRLKKMDEKGDEEGAGQ